MLIAKKNRLRILMALFIIQTSDRILFFLPYLIKPIILQFFTILQDKLHSFNIQDDQSTRFLCTTNYSIDHIIKRFHEENSIMTGRFSKKNLVLCDMQGKKIPKTTFSASRTGSHFWQAPNLQYRLIELTFKLRHDRKFLCLGSNSIYLQNCLWFVMCNL